MVVSLCVRVEHFKVKICVHGCSQSFSSSGNPAKYGSGTTLLNWKFHESHGFSSNDSFHSVFSP